MTEKYEVNEEWRPRHLGGRGFVGGLSHVGGYTFLVLDILISVAFGRHMAWDIYSVPMPRDEDNMLVLKGMLDSSVWANVRKNKVHMIFIYGTTEWGVLWAKNSIRITNAEKISKRVAGLASRRALVTQVSSLCVKVVPHTQYVESSLLSLIKDEDQEKLLDGTGVINKDLYDKMVQDWDTRVRSTKFNIEGDALVPGDHGYRNFDIEQMAKRFSRGLVVNLRAFTPEGLLKGNFVIMDSEEMLRVHGSANIDLIVPEGAYKAGVEMPKGMYFLTAEVQEAHDNVHNDVQTDVNLRALNTDAFHTEVAKDFFAKMKAKLFSGRVLDGPGEALRAQVAAYREEDLGFEYSDLKNRFAGAELVARGVSLRTSETLLRGAATAKAKMIIKPTKDGKAETYRIPVPCALYAQVISESASRMWGYTEAIPSGKGRVWRQMKVVVLTDLDYIRHYTNFGGCDLDDFFKIFFRTVEGVKSLVICRSPNGFGEYGVFGYHEGDYCPKWTKANGQVVSFPTIKGKLPKQLDRAIEDGDVSIMDLDNQVSGMYTGLPVTRDDVWARIEAAYNSNVSTGMLVYAVGLWSLVMGEHIPFTYGTLETFIDLTTQEDLSDEAATRLNDFAQLLINVVAASGKEIDAKFWNERGFAKKLTPKFWENTSVDSEMVDGFYAKYAWDKSSTEAPKPNLVETGRNAFFSIRFKHVKAENDKFLAYAKKLGSMMEAHEGVHELGALRLGRWGNISGEQGTGIAALLRTSRAVLAQAFSSAKAQDRNLTDEEWAAMDDQLLSALTHDGEGNLLEEHAQYDNVLALASANYKFRRRMFRCSFGTCEAKASGSMVEWGGNTYHVCITHKLALKAKVDNHKLLRPVEFTDRSVTNPAVFPLYVDALEAYGLANPLGSTEEDKVEDWGVVCIECGADHVFEDAVKFQRFMVRGNVCKACRTKKEA